MITNKTYDILHAAQAAIVTSGTATLEAGLFEVPQVVCYKTSGFTYRIIKTLIKVPYISLVNLIAGRKVVPELIQGELNTGRLQQELAAIVETSPARQQQLEGYASLKKIMGDHRPSEQAASLMADYLHLPA